MPDILSADNLANSFTQIMPEFLSADIYFCKRFGPRSYPCLATDASLTANPGVASSIPARSHTFVEIDHEIISTVILLPSAESFKKGKCGSRGGDRGSGPPPGKSQVIWVSIGNKQLDPPPPGKCWIPSETLKNDRFL